MAHDETQIIEEFRQAMAHHGIVVTGEIVADGKFHRVHVDGDRKKSRNGFYVLHLDGKKPAGAFGCNKRYGNEAKFTWAGETRELSLEERRAWAQLAAKKRAEREAREAEERRAAAQHAQFMWDQAKPCDGDDHPYLKRKGVKSHGLRVGVWEKIDAENGTVDVISERALLVPIRDMNKRIHSLQAIFTGKVMGDRDKDFVRGGAKEGLFYSIGKPQPADVGGQHRNVIMIGEGYATVATAHEATGHAAVVAFDAGNLLPVARQLRQRYPDFAIVFLADNDQWTTKPIENPGLTKAREAAKLVDGVIAYPPFAHDAQGKPTDWNDWAKAHGLESARDLILQALNPPPVVVDQPDDLPPWEGEAEPPAAQLAAPLPPPVAEPERPENNGYFRILGYNKGTYYFYLHLQKQIKEMSVSGMGESGLIELAPLNWWELEYPGQKTKIDTRAAVEFLVRTAERRGIYDPSKVRGRGAWIDNGRVVYHHGDYLSVDGQPTDVAKVNSRYVYELARSLLTPADDELTDAEGRQLLDIARQFRWRSEGSAALLAGWVALAAVCGALPWRPHVWLTGGAGCGKSTVLNKFVHGLLKGIDLYSQGSSSESGIRQELSQDALPVLFDESESNEESDARRIQNILSMIRQASTESDAKVYKGSAGGEAVSYHIRSMFCLASIQVALKQQADVDRLAVLVLKPRREDNDAAGTWKRISEALWMIERDDTIQARLFRRSLNLLPTTLQNIKVFSRAAAEHFNSQRDGDQYGTMLAGAWSLTSRELATLEQAKAMIASFRWDDLRDNGESDESTRAMQALMEAHVRVKGGAELTVYELVKAASGQQTGITEINDVTADAILQRYGMRVKGGWLVLSNNSNELRKLMQGSTFEADYRGVLLRVDGADKNGNKPERFNGVQTKCIRLPLGPVLGDEAAF